MNLLMLKADRVRTVTQEGVKFTLGGQGGTYIAEELQHYWKCKVVIRYNPEDLLVASLSACHMLWYLHLCAEAGIG